MSGLECQPRQQRALEGNVLGSQRRLLTLLGGLLFSLGCSSATASPAVPDVGELGGWRTPQVVVLQSDSAPEAPPPPPKEAPRRKSPERASEGPAEESSTVEGDGNDELTSEESGGYIIGQDGKPVAVEGAGVGGVTDSSAELEEPQEVEDTDPTALTDFEPELAPYGRWVEDSRYGTVWVPDRSAVGTRFAPYVTAGRWALGPNDQWVWASDYPFGWVVFHYGRWVYAGSNGWAWIPGRRYSHAWVHFRTSPFGDPYIGWAPMAPAFIWRGGRAVRFGFGAPLPFVYVSTRYVFHPSVRSYLIYEPFRVRRLARRTRLYRARRGWRRRYVSPPMRALGPYRQSAPRSRVTPTYRGRRSRELSKQTSTRVRKPTARRRRVSPPTRRPRAGRPRLTDRRPASRASGGRIGTPARRRGVVSGRPRGRVRSEAGRRNRSRGARGSTTAARRSANRRSASATRRAPGASSRVTSNAPSKRARPKTAPSKKTQPTKAPSKTARSKKKLPRKAESSKRAPRQAESKRRPKTSERRTRPTGTRQSSGTSKRRPARSRNAPRRRSSPSGQRRTAPRGTSRGRTPRTARPRR